MEDEMLFYGNIIAAALPTLIAVTLKRYPEYEREIMWIDFKLNEMWKYGVRILEYSLGIGC